MKKFGFLPIAVFVCIFNFSLFAQESKPGAIPSWTKGNKKAEVTIEIFNDY